MGLTPPGVSSNEVISDLISDIVKCATSGVDIVAPNGQIVRIFVDIVGYIGDFPAVTHVLDTTGHNGTSCCHLCTFLKLGKKHAGSVFAWCLFLTSFNSATAKSRERCLLLRDVALLVKHLKFLGIQKDATVDSLPLHALSTALSEVFQKVPRSSTGLPVVSCSFDPYRSSFVAPDHLLSGLARNIISAACTLLSKSLRIAVNHLICTSLA